MVDGIFDSHAHYDDDAFDADRDALLSALPGRGVALVVCPGGGDPRIQLRLLEAVSALTGLGTDRISICQGNT